MLYRFRGLITFISDKWQTEYMCLFTSDEFEGELKECDEGDLVWVEKEKIHELNLWKGDRVFLKLLDTRQDFFTLKLRYEGEVLVESVVYSHSEVI